MKSVPGVMQLESNRSSLGKISPLPSASFSIASAALAERNLEEASKLLYPPLFQ